MHSLTRLAKVSALIVVKIKTRTPFRGEGRVRVIQKSLSSASFTTKKQKKEKSLAIIRQNTTAAILVLHCVT